MPAAVTTRGGAALLAALLALLAPGCGNDAPARPNVLLLTIDTLRADRLEAWGYARPTSPAIARLAEQSVVFTEAQASSSWTLPSLSSLMTSLPPSTLDIWGYGSHLDPAFTTLAERLQQAGWRTAGIGSHIYLGARFGLHQGFDEFDVELVRPQLASQLAISSPEVTDKAIAWLRARRDDPRPWLLWVHYFDPHSVYHPHPGISERFGSEAHSDLYDGEIAFTDLHMGRLLTELDAQDLADETIVVLTADHGEEFHEHGLEGHGAHLQREVLHVPLLFRVPGSTPRRIGTTVSLVDVLPTLLELLGLEPGQELEGRSLAPVLRGGAPLGPHPVLSEVRLHDAEDSLTLGEWKLVRNHLEKRARLYHVSSDPGEQHDLAAERPDVAARLASELGRRVREATARGRQVTRTGKPPLLSEEERQALRDLGYIE